MVTSAPGSMLPVGAAPSARFPVLCAHLGLGEDTSIWGPLGPGQETREKPNMDTMFPNTRHGRLRRVKSFALAVLTAGILSAARAAASEPAHVSISRAPDEKFESIFVGHYGEVLRFPSKFAVEAELRDGIEVVRFHDKTLDPYDMVRSTIPDTFLASRRSPSPKEYVVENFTPKRLMEVLVIPKSSPGYESLKALRQAKVKELESSGCKYRVSDMEDFPKDSFLAYITEPYGLRQLYSQSDKHFFILTIGSFPVIGGRLLPADNLGPYAGQLLFNSLESYLDHFRNKLNLDPFEMFHQPVFYYIWLGANALWLAMAFLPGRRKWLARLRLIGRATLIFSNALAVFGWLVIYAAARLDVYRWCNEASAIFAVAVLMPWICLAGSTAFGGRRLGRVFWWSMAISVPLAFIAGQGVIYAHQFPRELKPDMSFLIVLIHIFLGIIYGTCFGLTHAVSSDQDEQESPHGGDAAVLALLLCLGQTLLLHADGINNAAREFSAYYASQPSRGGGDNYDPPSRDRENHSVDLSHAQEVVRRLRSPF